MRETKVYLHGTFLQAENLIPAAVAAEEVGFFGLTLSDHLVYPRDLASAYPLPETMWAPTDPWPEPWVTFGALAGATTSLRFATAIYIATARPLLEVAKLVSTAAVISGYRIAMGVGVGWMREEYDLMGQDFERRGARLDEMLAALKTIWRGGYQEHHGDFYDIPPVAMYPTPEREIPIFVGGDAPVSLRRAARHDGWVGMHYEFDRIKDLLGQLREARRSAGTEHREDFEVMLMHAPVPDADRIRELEELGVTSLFVSPWESENAFQKDPGRDAVLRSIDAYGSRVLAVTA